MTKPNKPTPIELPSGAVGRWPLEQQGYIENIYETNPQRPWIDFIDVYGHPIRAKLTRPDTNDVAISYFPSLPGPGRYNIEVFIPSQNADNPQADYHVNYFQRGALTDLQVTIDQTKYSNEWVPLGMFELDPSRVQDGQVNITDYSPAGSFLMSFSGVRWVPPLSIPPRATIEGKTNQDIINGFIVVASQFNEKFDAFVAKANLNGIYTDRKATYTGPAVNALPLSQDRKDALNLVFKMDSAGLAKAAVEASKPKVVKGKIDGRTWGVHGSAGAAAPPRHMWDFWIGEYKAMGLKWYKQCDNGGADYGDGTIFRWVLALRDAGIAPVIRYQNPRMYPKRLEPSFWDKMNGYIKEGVVWAEVGNEPNLSWEWELSESFVNWHNPDCIKAICEVWIQDAEEALRRGAKPAWYAMAPTDWQGGTNHVVSNVKFNELCWNYLGTHYRDRARAVMKNGGWVAVHVSPYEFPLDFDPFNHGVGGKAPWDMCMRGYEIPAKYIQNNIGLTMGTDYPMMSTEGGVFTPESTSVRGHQRLADDNAQADLMIKMFNWLEENSPMQGMMPWCLAVDDRIGHKPEEYVTDGWYLERNGQFGPRSVVQRLKDTKKQRG